MSVADNGAPSLRALIGSLLVDSDKNSGPTDRATQSWEEREADSRRAALTQFIESYTPWLLPRFETLFEASNSNEPIDRQVPKLEAAADYAADLSKRLAEGRAALRPDSEQAVLSAELQSLLVPLRATWRS